MPLKYLSFITSSLLQFVEFNNSVSIAATSSALIHLTNVTILSCDQIVLLFKVRNPFQVRNFISAFLD